MKRTAFNGEAASKFVDGILMDAAEEMAWATAAFEGLGPVSAPQLIALGYVALLRAAQYAPDEDEIEVDAALAQALRWALARQREIGAETVAQT